MADIYLIGCTDTITAEIAAGARQSDVALTYALAMRSEAAGADKPNWPTINRAIIARWSRAGLGAAAIRKGDAP